MNNIKRIISLILTAVMLITCTAVSPVLAAGEHNIVEPGSNGDPNGDGRISLHDVGLVLKYIAGWEIEGEFIFDAAEVNLDNKITLEDARRILRHIAQSDVPTLGE